jgi:hypothetical protein
MTYNEFVNELMELHNSRCTVEFGDFHMDRSYYNAEIEDTFRAEDVQIMDKMIGYSIFPEYESVIRVKFDRDSPIIDFLSSDITASLKFSMMVGALRNEIFYIYLRNGYYKRAFRYIYNYLFARTYANTLYELMRAFDKKLIMAVNSLLAEISLDDVPDVLDIFINTNWVNYYDEFVEYDNRLRSVLKHALPLKKEHMDINGILNDDAGITCVKSMICVTDNAECKAVLLRWLKKHECNTEENIEL